MLSGDKNLKDSEKDMIKDNFSAPASYEVKNFYFSSYTKTHKLITALYMVTDIMDKDEPMRNRLRHLGTEIISDMHSKPANTVEKITEVMSFLSIAGAMNFISEMNCAVLKKEFFDFKNAVQDHVNIKPTWITEFLSQDSQIEEFDSQKPYLTAHNFKGQSKGHVNISKGQQRTRIGVQKSSTLMKVLSDRTSFLSGNDRAKTDQGNFNELKKQRREDIIKIIKNNGGNATIKDIKIKLDMDSNGVSSIGEKTLQRELMSLTKDGVLNKVGEKRWSRYFLK